MKTPSKSGLVSRTMRTHAGALALCGWSALALCGWSAPARAVGVSPMSTRMDADGCPAKCRVTITVTGSPGEYMGVTLQDYQQDTTGQRIYVPVPAADKRHGLFSIKDATFGQPIKIPETGELKIVVTGQRGLGKLRGAQTAFGFAVSQIPGPANVRAPRFGDAPGVGMTVAATFIVRIDIDGLSTSGLLKLAHLGSETVSGHPFEKLSIANTTSRPITLRLDGRIKDADGKIDKGKKLRVLYQTMIPDFLSGKPETPLTIGPGSLVYLYVPVKDLTGRKLKVLGSVQGGRRLSSKEFVIGETRAPAEVVPPKDDPTTKGPPPPPTPPAPIK